MKAHIIHDADGAIRSVVFQGTEVQGELEISTDQAGDSVTIVDLDEAIAAGTPGGTDATAESSQDLASLARKVRSEFKIGAGKTLERLSKQ